MNDQKENCSLLISCKIKACVLELSIPWNEEYYASVGLPLEDQELMHIQRPINIVFCV